MPSLLTRVKSKLFIASSRKSMHALDGAYASLLRGRSLDFEDLRAYEYGDQVRDIDWRATARLGSPMIKRSKATRMHTVLFAVDTSRSMAALAPDERPKKDLAVLTVGALGVLSLRHGDDFTVVSGDAVAVKRTAVTRSEAALEHALRRIDAAGSDGARSDRAGILRYIARTIARRMIVVIITDDAPVTEEDERLLRRLRVQHDVLWLTIADANPVLDHTTKTARVDALTAWAIPGFAHGDDAIVRELAERDEAEASRRDSLLDSLEITHATLTSQDTAIGDLLRLLNRRRYVGSR